VLYLFTESLREKSSVFWKYVSWVDLSDVYFSRLLLHLLSLLSLLLSERLAELYSDLGSVYF